MLRMTKTGLLAAALALFASSAALAQDPEQGDIDVNLPARKVEKQPEPITHFKGRPGPLRVFGGFHLAVGGSLDDKNIAYSPDLDPTVGLQGGADYVLHDYFAIGGEMRFLWWKVDGAGDRSFFWDIAVKPRGRYAFANIPLEVYGALPIGLTVPGLAGGLEGKVGWNIGIVAGAYYFFTENIGVNAEIGWAFHQFKYGIEGLPGSSSAKMNQFVCIPTANFVYAL